MTNVGFDFFLNALVIFVLTVLSVKLLLMVLKHIEIVNDEIFNGIEREEDGD